MGKAWRCFSFLTNKKIKSIDNITKSKILGEKVNDIINNYKNSNNNITIDELNNEIDPLKNKMDQIIIQLEYNQHLYETIIKNQKNHIN
jgi:hypothetical protein